MSAEQGSSQGYSQEWMTQALQTMRKNPQSLAIPSHWKKSDGYVYTGRPILPGVIDGFGINVTMVSLDHKGRKNGSKVFPSAYLDKGEKDWNEVFVRQRSSGMDVALPDHLVTSKGETLRKYFPHIKEVPYVQMLSYLPIHKNGDFTQNPLFEFGAVPAGGKRYITEVFDHGNLLTEGGYIIDVTGTSITPVDDNNQGYYFTTKPAGDMTPAELDDVGTNAGMMLFVGVPLLSKPKYFLKPGIPFDNLYYDPMFQPRERDNSGLFGAGPIMKGGPSSSDFGLFRALPTKSTFSSQFSQVGVQQSDKKSVGYSTESVEIDTEGVPCLIECRVGGIIFDDPQIGGPSTPNLLK